jgi:hypothetical protein
MKLLIETKDLKGLIPDEVLIDLQKNAEATIAQEVVQRAKKAANNMQHTVSQLLEEVQRQFRSQYAVPNAARQLFREIAIEVLAGLVKHDLRKLVNEEVAAQNRQLDQRTIDAMVTKALRSRLA